MGAHSSDLMDQMDVMSAVTAIVAMIEHTTIETIARFVWGVAKQGHSPSTVQAVRGERSTTGDGAVADGGRMNIAEVREEICNEIQHIMETYREQEAEGEVDTPGGLEHMGDVWRLLRGWDQKLTEAA